jgi:hypothetical protein
MFHFAALARKRVHAGDDRQDIESGAPGSFLRTYQPVFAASRSFMLLQSPAQPNSSLDQSKNETVQQ